MDENSCEEETSKSVENVVDGQKQKEVDNPFELEDMKVKTGLEDEKINRNQVSDRCGSSYDASVSGTSTSFSPLVTETPENEVTAPPPPPPPPDNVDETVTNEENTVKPTQDETIASAPLLPIYEESQGSQAPPVRMTTFVEEHLTTRKGSIGPPPSYSFVMKQKKRVKMPSVDPVITSRPPPPAYAGSRGLYITPEEGRLERICNLPSFGEPIWRSHSQPAFCSRCGVIVLTTTHSHDSIATHLAALALCLFGCWPCCLLPYCMNVCKNTYHHCPVCQAFLGVYSPW